MKAYQVRDIHHHEGWSDVVFAESAKEAKGKAFGTDVCADAEWIDIRVNRLPEVDGMQDYTTDELNYELIKIGWWFDFGNIHVTEENLQEAVEKGYVKSATTRDWRAMRNEHINRKNIQVHSNARKTDS